MVISMAKRRTDETTEVATLELPKRRWRVTLNCPTPLQFPSLEVEAGTDEDAKAAFCKANNISGSAHDWQVEEVR